MFVTLALLASSAQLAREPTIYIAANGAACELLVEGQKLPNDQLGARAAAWKREGQTSVRVVAPRSLPYRCAGIAIYELQRGGVLQIHFAGMPAQISITVPSGPCRVEIDGKPATFANYRRQARRWAHTRPNIRFQPDPAAGYECVDRALQVLKTAHPMRLGFIGNEAYDPNGEKQ